MDLITVLGLVAGTLTTLSFLPQLIKTWQTKSAKDISLWMLVAFCTGVFLWLIYGLCIGALPIVIANLTTLILASVILAFKLKFE